METVPTAPDRTPAPQTPEACSVAKRPYRVISFPGAGFDTVMQMGVVHALLVTRRKAPDMVAGISVGAITATALGEVLQANAGANASADEDEEVRVARFSELLEAFRNAPSTILKGFFPDPLKRTPPTRSSPSNCRDISRRNATAARIPWPAAPD